MAARDHLADDRHVLQALGRARRRRRPLRRLRPQRRRPQAGDAQAPGRQRRGPHARTPTTATCTSWPPRRGPTSSRLGEKNGFRNAQASVLAPTGTIGFMMDCDTTGIEPDFSLVKFKKLVGGGSMQIVNQTIPRALKKLGYQPGADRGDRRVHRRARPRHRRPGPQDRALRGLRHRDGRPRAQADGPRADDGGGAAVPVRRDLQDGQPARDGHGRGDRGHLPAVAGSSASRRPRSTATTARSASRCPTAAASAKKDQAATTRPPPSAVETKVVEKVVYAPTRKRLPKSRASRTTSFTVGGAEGYMTSGAHDDGELGEVFLKLGKQGSTLAGVMDAFSIACQHRPAVRRPAGDLRLEVHQPALRAGRPHRRPGRPDGAVDHGLHLPPPGPGLPVLRGALRARHLLRRGAPAPPRDRLLRARRSRRPAPPPSSSRPTTTVRRAREPVETKDSHGVEAREVPAKPAPKEAHTSAELLEKITGTAVDSPLCFTCGTKMRPAGSCYVCEGCGSTSGCS